MNERSKPWLPFGPCSLRVICLGLVLAWGCALAPAPASARQRMSFTPGEGSHHGMHARRSLGASKRYAARPLRHNGSRHAARGVEDGGAAAPPPPGSGFKVIDGVLTYPAPARFQPKNLKHN